jgi:cellobiose-specific phosphotransferase system component IIC
MAAVLCTSQKRTSQLHLVRRTEMSPRNKFVAILAAAILSVPAMFLGSFALLQRVVQSEFESGARTSTNGDTVMIPAVGLTAGWTALLLAAGAIFGTVSFLRRSRIRRGAV